MAKWNATIEILFAKQIKLKWTWKLSTFYMKQLQIVNFAHKNVNRFWSWKCSILSISFFREKMGFVSKHFNLVVIWSLPLVLLKILKKDK